MKIVLAGGGSGGHFYPLIAIAEQLRTMAEEEKILDMKLYYMSDVPYEKTALFENQITFVSATSGKRRLYSSFKNFTDLFKIATGVIQATLKMYYIYPDVVVAKGGYASFPALILSLSVPPFT